ncbi:helix-turn-helix domain-containing protein [Psychromonas sp. KJ10-2]|uniref:helix-turn-helix domain-containing protein n=1 Tax=Psychromonas sp. KJ10-2 TaxID=3391822 RepID=UPI0039B4D4E6
MEKNNMKFQGKLKQVLPKGTFIRTMGDLRQKTIFSDSHSISSNPTNKKQSLALIEGDLISYQADNSFILHGGKTKELVDFQVLATAKKSLCITILLEGKLDFGYDDLNFLYDAIEQPRAVIVSLTRSVSFRRTLYKNNQVTKLNLILPHEWIAQRILSDDNFSQLVNQHLAHFELQINAEIIALTSDIIKSSKPTSHIEQMNLESLTQQLLLQVFVQLNDATQALNQFECGHSAHESLQYDPVLDKLVSYIEANLDQDMSVSDLAKFSAMSISSLQHKFKNSMGVSVLSYIRRRRLNIAKQLLEAGSISISEAAYNAGYRHPSNFTSAFKKVFGIPPQDLMLKTDQV